MEYNNTYKTETKLPGSTMLKVIGTLLVASNIIFFLCLILAVLIIIMLIPEMGLDVIIAWIVPVFIVFISLLISTAAGIIAIIYHNSESKIMLCMASGLVLLIVSIIATFVLNIIYFVITQQFVFFSLLQFISSFALPICYLYGVNLNSQYVRQKNLNIRS